MKRYFSYDEFEKVLEYSLNEKDKESIIKTDDSDKKKDDKEIKILKVKDKETGEKKVDKTNIPKDVLVKALAKDLYNAQLRVFTIQNETDDLIAKMTKEDPENPEIATFTANAAMQVANAQLHADTIEMQMMAAGSISPTLTIVATELGAEAKNLAMKKGLELFDKYMKKLKNKNIDNDSKSDDNEKETESK